MYRLWCRIALYLSLIHFIQNLSTVDVYFQESNKKNHLVFIKELRSTGHSTPSTPNIEGSEIIGRWIYHYCLNYFFYSFINATAFDSSTMMQSKYWTSSLHFFSCWTTLFLWVFVPTFCTFYFIFYFDSIFNLLKVEFYRFSILYFIFS